MTAGTFPKLWTIEDFLAWENQQEERYEFVDGMIRSMTGGTVDHAAITGNIHSALRDQVRAGPCRAFATDLKVRAGENAMYPDVLITCGQPDPKATEVTDPVVIVEVLSKSTSDYDRGRKWLAYQSISSLSHFLLVSQDECRVDAFRRMANGWYSETMSDHDGEIALSAVNVRLRVRDIYEGSSVAARLAG
jgi:Uma2 family endonuclease